ncbi:hypothetical protein BH20ACT5_BH20ACT5_14850 [soil metagenome]
MTAPDQRPPWDLGHLRPGLAVTAALAAIGVPLLWLLRGQRAGLAVLLGLAIVAASFCLSAYAVAWAGRVADSLTLPAALGSYLIKVVLLGVVLVSVPADGPIEVKALAWTVLVGTLTWVAVHIRRVWRQPLLYVDSP